jgi:hypothetical protein
MSNVDDFIARNPHPGNDPVTRLRHTLDAYPNADDDRLAIQATTGMYPQGDTGLTFGDLRAIARMIGA